MLATAVAAAQSSSLICILIGRRYASEREPAVDRKGSVMSRTIRKRERFGCTIEPLEKLQHRLLLNRKIDTRMLSLDIFKDRIGIL